MLRSLTAQTDALPFHTSSHDDTVHGWEGIAALLSLSQCDFALDWKDLSIKMKLCALLGVTVDLTLPLVQCGLGLLTPALYLPSNLNVSCEAL